MRPSRVSAMKPALASGPALQSSRAARPHQPWRPGAGPGNQAMLRLLSGGASSATWRTPAPDRAREAPGPSALIQRKPMIGPANDPLEREADRTAEAVLAGSPVPAASVGRGSLQRMCAGCEGEEEGTVRRAATSGSPVGGQNAGVRQDRSPGPAAAPGAAA